MLSALTRRDIQTERADEVIAAFRDALNEPSPYRSGAGTTMVDFADAWSRVIDRRPPKFPETEFTLRLSLATVNRGLGRNEESKRHALRAVELAKNTVDMAPIEIVRAYVLLVDALQAIGDDREAEKILSEAERRAQDIVLPTSSLGLTLRIQRAFGESKDGKIESAARAMATLREDVQKTPSIHPLDRLRVATLELFIVHAAKDFAAAATIGASVIELHEKTSGLKNAQACYALSMFADSLWRLGRLGEADDAAKKAIENGRGVMRPTQAEFQQALWTAASIAHGRGDAERAAALFDEFINAARTEPTPDSPMRVPFAMRVLAVLRMNAKRLDEADRLSKECVALIEALPTIPAADRLETDRVRAMVLCECSKFKEAYASGIAALTRHEASLSARHPAVLETRLVAGYAALHCDMLTEAITLFRAILTAVPGDGDPCPNVKRTVVLDQLARALAEDDQDAEAKRVRAEAARLKKK